MRNCNAQPTSEQELLQYEVITWEKKRVVDTDWPISNLYHCSSHCNLVVRLVPEQWLLLLIEYQISTFHVIWIIICFFCPGNHSPSPAVRSESCLSLLLLPRKHGLHFGLSWACPARQGEVRRRGNTGLSGRFWLLAWTRYQQCLVVWDRRPHCTCL